MVGVPTPRKLANAANQGMQGGFGWESVLPAHNWPCSIGQTLIQEMGNNGMTSSLQFAWRFPQFQHCKSHVPKPLGSRQTLRVGHPRNTATSWWEKQPSHAAKGRETEWGEVPAYLQSIPIRCDQVHVHR